MTTHLRSLDPRLAKALANEMRGRILSLIAQQDSSPKGIADALGEDVRMIAYHVRVLKKLGCIELVGTRPRRGAVEHVYRAADWVLAG